MIYLIAAISALLGLAAGTVLCYIYGIKPLALQVNDLTRHVLTMRKQGFVPQFELEQRRLEDPAAEIREF